MVKKIYFAVHYMGEIKRKWDKLGEREAAGNLVNKRSD